MKSALRLAAVVLLIAATGAGWVVYKLYQPYQGFSEPVFIDFAHGSSTKDMADLLAQQGVIEDRWLFLAARALRRRATLQAGEYRFDKPASAMDIFGRIARGDIFYMEVLIPEGYNIFDIAEAVGRLGSITPGDFLKAARDASLISDLDPKAPTLEGYLFPSTYRVTRHTSARQLCRMMTEEFRRRWREIHATSDVHAAVTLASLVEREAKLKEERPLVASVFANRLHIGMKLDCDPTTVYAALMENRYRGTIFRSDLNNPSEWNTYQHPGLPPGAIANPGISAIRAALEPARTGYLYFVAKADGSGGHNFSESLVKHEAAVAHYRQAVHH